MPRKQASRKRVRKKTRKDDDMIKALEARTRLLVGKDYTVSNKDLERLEKQLDKFNENASTRIKRLESAFITFSSAIDAMKKEQEKLIKEKEKLEVKNRELELRIGGIDVGAIATAAADKVQKSVHDNVELMQHLSSGKDDDYETILENREAGKDLREEDKTALSLMKKGGKRNLEKVKYNELGQLYLFVRDAEMAKTSDASKVLNMDEAFIEGLAETLKDHKLIKIQYPAFGKPVLLKK